MRKAHQLLDGFGLAQDERPEGAAQLVQHVGAVDECLGAVRQPKPGGVDRPLDFLVAFIARGHGFDREAELGQPLQKVVMGPVIEPWLEQPPVALLQLRHVGVMAVAEDRQFNGRQALGPLRIASGNQRAVAQDFAHFGAPGRVAVMLDQFLQRLRRHPAGMGLHGLEQLLENEPAVVVDIV